MILSLLALAFCSVPYLVWLVNLGFLKQGYLNVVSPYGSTVRRMDTLVNQLVLFSRVAGEKLIKNIN